MGATIHALLTSPGPGYLATSTTSFTVGTGSITVTAQSGLAYTAGARVRISSSASPTNYVEGLCTSYSGTSLTITSDTTGGSGTFASWNINLAGNAGAAGAQGPTGSAFNTTSTTNLTIGAGSASFTIASSGLPYSAGVRARAASAGNLNNFMEGVVTSYIGTTLVINVDTVGGSGTHNDWNINIAGQPGTNGTNGTNGTGYLATSTTSQAIGTGAVTLVTQSGLAYVTGDEILIVSGANSANYMQGSVTSYSGTSLVVNVVITSGSGTHSDWNISLTGLPGPGFFATSTTSVLIGTGSQTFTTQSGLAYTAGAVVLFSSQANSANYMLGTVTSYSGTTMIINVTATGGSGTHADWNINASGQQGPSSALTTATAALAADVTLSTATTTGPSVSLSAGTWMVIAYATIISSNSSTIGNAAFWIQNATSATALAEGGINVSESAGSAATGTGTLATIVTLGVTSTIEIQIKDTSASAVNTLKKNTTIGPGTSPATYIMAVKIA